MARKASSRNYSARTLKMLWGRAAGRCAIPNCRIELFYDATEHDPTVIIGDIAHIEASSDKGPRANKHLSRKERDEYENLILLCQNCHTRLDGQKNTNSAEKIKNIKDDHEAWVRNCLPERGKSSTGWTTLWLQGAYPFDLEAICSALSPDFPAGDPIVIKANQNADDWNVIHQRLIDSTKELFNNIDSFDSRIAVFALAPVSACLGLGFYLTSRPRVRLYQYHRDEESWNWPEESTSLENAIQIDGLPIQVDYNTKVVAFCFSLSATIATNDINDYVDKIDSVINLSIGRPHTGWLSNISQLKELAQKTREVFEESLRLFPSTETWHIFYAGPAPGGVVVGQQINPTMCPRVQFYEYRRNKTPVYQPSFTVGDYQ